MLAPIGPEQQREVIAATEEYIEQAGRLYRRQFKSIPILFDLSGRTAGMFKVVGRKRCIRYNPWIFAKYYTENLSDTVPHEVAHYIIYELYVTGTVKPHGRQWRALMAHFGADPGVTFNLDLEGIPSRKQKTHPYRCNCTVHQVSSTRHNRVLKGKGQYLCRLCDSSLVYMDEAAIPVN